MFSISDAYTVLGVGYYDWFAFVLNAVYCT